MRKPVGIQLRRTKGWRLPPGARSVSRPGPFGNPFIPLNDSVEARQAAVDAFAQWVRGGILPFSLLRRVLLSPQALGALSARRARLLSRLPELRGRDLACWCSLGGPCHRNPLLEIANE